MHLMKGKMSVMLLRQINVSEVVSLRDNVNKLVVVMETEARIFVQVDLLWLTF